MYKRRLNTDSKEPNSDYWSGDGSVYDQPYGDSLARHLHYGDGAAWTDDTQEGISQGRAGGIAQYVNVFTAITQDVFDGLLLAGRTRI